MHQLLVATHNPGKIREYRHLLSELPLHVTWLDEAGVAFDVEETGVTFTENACLKAETYARHTGCWTWADDSGLEVDALHGRPGVYSARYGGLNLSDRERYLRLLDELRAVPWHQRTARFRCVVAIAVPGGPIYTAEGVVEGIIVEEPRGEHGFGYDPIFFLPEYAATMAELRPTLKNRISHRSLAAANAGRILSALLENQASESE